MFSVRFTNLNTNRERGTQKREQLYWQIVGNPGIVTGGCGVIALGPIADEPVTDGGVSGAVAWDDRLGGAPTPDDAGVPMFEDPILPTPVWPSVPMPEPMPDPTPEPTASVPGAVLRPEPTRGVPAGGLAIPGCGEATLGGVPSTGEPAPIPGTAGGNVPGTTIELGVAELKRAD